MAEGDRAAAEGATDPAATDPAATDPAATDPAATDPAATDSVPAARGSEDWFRGLVMALGEGLVLHTADGRTVECNPAAERILGLSRQELLVPTRPHGLTFLRPDGSPLLADELPIARVLRTGRPCREVEVGLQRGDGPLRWLLVGAEPLVRAGEGAPYAVVATFTDVTELHRAREALADSEERFRLAFDEALSGMTLMSIEPVQPGRFLRANRAFCDFLGYSAQELAGMSFRDITHPDDLSAAREAVSRFLSGQVATYRGERRYLRRTGETVWAAFSVAMVRNGRGVPLYAVGMFEDVTARRQAEQELRHRALHDELTGLPNRALLMDHLAASLARSRRAGTRVGVLFVDLDDFKTVNDSHGHAVGDALLRQVAERIGTSLRGGDTAARIGGDEFVVVCENLADLAEAEVVARRIQQELGRELLVCGQPLAVPLSIGIALGDAGSTADSLLRDADTAMYRAKREGGQRWEVGVRGPHEAAVRAATVEGELRRALAATDQLVVHYQPIYDLGSGAVVAAEALLRWRHPDRGVLAAADFLDVVEQRGLVGAIGDRVLAAVLDRAAHWRRRFAAAAPLVCLNVWTRQLGDHGVSRLVRELGAVPREVRELICLEISERGLPPLGPAALADLELLVGGGVRVAVDDVGTGPAGLGYLRRTPVHLLKVDTALVAGLGTDRTDTALVAGLVALGRSLDLTMVAEGVETAAQLDALQRLGCAWGQGWLWSPAVPAAQLELLLAEGSQLRRS